MSRGVPARRGVHPIAPPTDSPPLEVRAPSRYSPPAAIWGGASECRGCLGRGVTKTGGVCYRCRGRGYIAKPEYVCQHICGCERFALIMVCDDCIDAVSNNVECAEYDWRNKHSKLNRNQK